MSTGDISSISGSDSESENEILADDVTSERTAETLDTDQSLCRLSSKVAFQNLEGQYLTLYRCVLQSKRVSKQHLLKKSKKHNIC